MHFLKLFLKTFLLVFVNSVAIELLLIEKLRLRFNESRSLILTLSLNWRLSDFLNVIRILLRELSRLVPPYLNLSALFIGLVSHFIISSVCSGLSHIGVFLVGLHRTCLGLRHWQKFLSSHSVLIVQLQHQLNASYQLWIVLLLLIQKNETVVKKFRVDLSVRQVKLA